MVPEPALLERFQSDLDVLIGRGERLGIAVSGGPDSLALLLLAAAARPDEVEAATVDHGFRAEGRAEAETVGEVCRELGVPHAILTVDWAEKPETAIQEQARAARYRLLGQWLADRDLKALATAHHADDQAETLVMRLNRGSGARGLAGMRPIARVPSSTLPLLRPLLGWRRAELEAICASASLTPAEDPSNEDERFERVRVRQALSDNGWIDVAAAGRSAANLASADEALDWAARREWDQNVHQANGQITYTSSPDAPLEILRRVAERALAALASEGTRKALRGRELDGLVEALQAGRTATMRGVLCSGGRQWQFHEAPARKSS
jgi:tRNA(Ile)-lysidine synthase